MPYTEEQKRSHIREIQGYLYQLARQDERIPLVIPDGIYGPETVAAVRGFQQTASLPVTGEVDRRTWDAIVAAYRALRQEALPIEVYPSTTYIIREGDDGTLVYMVQVMLNALADRYIDLSSVPVSGKYDAMTTKAVREMQERADLPTTGIVDQSTWNSIVMGVNTLKLLS